MDLNYRLITQTNLINNSYVINKVWVFLIIDLIMFLKCKYSFIIGYFCKMNEGE